MLGNNLFLYCFLLFLFTEDIQGEKACWIVSNECLCYDKAQVIAVLTERTVCHTAVLAQLSSVHVCILYCIYEFALLV